MKESDYCQVQVDRELLDSMRAEVQQAGINNPSHALLVNAALGLAREVFLSGYARAPGETAGLPVFAITDEMGPIRAGKIGVEFFKQLSNR